MNKRGKKMKNKKEMMIFALFLFGIFLINSVFAVGEVTYCAERTLGGAWCQNVPLAEADQDYRFTPTSCEATSYCRLGTCVDVQEGVCMENTPQKVCEEPVGGVAGGLWFNQNPSEIPQCQLGCCLIGEQAAFATQTRCEQLSSLYGLESNYRTDIRSEAQCIASAFPTTKGACVYDEDLQTRCKFITKQECTDIETQKENVKFNQGFLCSAEELGTICGPSEKTTIVDGRDEVFFVDTCGNVANIYDATKQNDRTYWDKIVSKAEVEASCGDGKGNANSRTCGNCDYLAGSTGALYDRFRDTSGAPDFGNHICRSLDCKFETDLNGDGDNSDDGEFGPFKHGESWCAQSAGTSEIISTNGQIPRIPNSANENTPGSRYFRLVCYNGDVTVESCADFRQEICIQSTITTNKGDFRTAACRVNQWQSCVGQSNQKDCENFDKRDCKWFGIETKKIKYTSGFLGLTKGKEESTEQEGRCLPKFAPGFDFYKEDGDAAAFCVQASAKCKVKFEKGLSGAFGDFQEDFVGGAGANYKCVENCECLGMEEDDVLKRSNLGAGGLDNDWITERNNMCLALGDCGVSENYIGDGGYHNIAEIAKVSDLKD